MTTQILVVSRDEIHPYFRPPLSKELWYEEDPEVGTNLAYMDGGKKKKITLMPPEDYKDNIMFLSGTAVVVCTARHHLSLSKNIAPDQRILVLKTGDLISYGKCLLATGSYPKVLEVPYPEDRVMTYRTVRVVIVRN